MHGKPDSINAFRCSSDHVTHRVDADLARSQAPQTREPLSLGRRAVDGAVGIYQAAAQKPSRRYPYWNPNLTLQQYVDYLNITYFAKVCQDGHADAYAIPSHIRQSWVCILIAMGCPSTELALVRYALGGGSSDEDLSIKIGLTD